MNSHHQVFRSLIVFEKLTKAFTLQVCAHYFSSQNPKKCSYFGFGFSNAGHMHRQTNKQTNTMFFENIQKIISTWKGLNPFVSKENKALAPQALTTLTDRYILKLHQMRMSFFLWEGLLLLSQCSPFVSQEIRFHAGRTTYSAVSAQLCSQRLCSDCM